MRTLCRVIGCDMEVLDLRTRTTTSVATGLVRGEELRECRRCRRTEMAIVWVEVGE